MQEINIRHLKEIQLELLKETILFCNNNNIQYFVTGGTLLGAVRHSGYIPWDDDIDLVMPRKDYDRFIRSFNNNRIDRFKVVSLVNDKLFPYIYAKVVDTHTILREQLNFNYNLGVYIDIFPLDNLTDSSINALMLYYKILILKKILSIKRADDYKKRRLNKAFILKILKVSLSQVKYYEIISYMDNLTKKYAYMDNCKYVGVMSLLAYGRGEILDRDIFSESTELNFEGFSVRAPMGYDKYLKSLYGDYMELPPPEKQVSRHSFKAWWK